MGSTPLKTSLQDFCTGEFDRIRTQFEATGNGQPALLARAGIVDRVIQELYQAHIASRF